MATSSAQINANIANAQLSSGPRSEIGKATSSKNSVVFGLYSGDFVRPGEEPIHEALKAALQQELNPRGVLEATLVDEIQRATWRLRRCGEVETNLVLRLKDGDVYILDPMEGSSRSAEDIQRSVDRARSQAHRLLHKCTAELRKLQTDGRIPAATQLESSETPLTQQTQSKPRGAARNAPCPCGSGQKHKRCCGRQAAPLLQAA